MVTMGRRCWELSDRGRWHNLFWQQHERQDGQRSGRDGQLKSRAWQIGEGPCCTCVFEVFEVGLW